MNVVEGRPFPDLFAYEHVQLAKPPHFQTTTKEMTLDPLC